MGETEQGNPTSDDPGGEAYRHYNPVTVTPTISDTVGAVFLGILAVILLIALLRTQARNRALAERLSQQ